MNYFMYCFVMCTSSNVNRITLVSRISMLVSLAFSKQPSIEEIRSALNIDKFEVYFVVPEHIFTEHYNKPQKFEGTQRNVLKIGLPNNVFQFVLKVSSIFKKQ